MKFTLAFDSYKDALRSAEVGRAVAEGIRAVLPAAEIVEIPLSDGGEGFVEAVAAASPGARLRDFAATDALGRPVTARTAFLADAAVVECASCCGIEQLTPAERDPRRTDTFGLGTLLRSVAASSPRRIVIGLGGSATVDGGLGMLRALGVRFYDEAGQLIETGGGEALMRVRRCDVSGAIALPLLTAACDVTNPLCGETGAAPVFGPQKGASPELVRALDAALARYGALLADAFGRPLSAPGDGAAGGLGFALRMLGADTVSGADLLFAWSDFDRRVPGSALLITGEGRSDAQTAAGKLPMAAARRAARLGVPAALVSGALADDAAALCDDFSVVMSIASGPGPLEAALAQTAANLRRAGANIAALVKTGGAR